MTEPFRTTSIRLPETLAARLDLVAEAQGIAMVEAIRRAITAYVDDPRIRKTIRESLRQRVEQVQQMLDSLDSADQSRAALTGAATTETENT